MANAAQGTGDLSDPLRRHQAYAGEAGRLAGLPREALAAGLASALSRAYEAGAAASGKAVRVERLLTLADLSPAARALAAALSGREGAGLAQGPLGLPGLPWHLTQGGHPVREGRYALRVPDAAVRELAGLGLLAAAGDGLAPTPALALLRGGGAAPRPGWAG